MFVHNIYTYIHKHIHILAEIKNKVIKKQDCMYLSRKITSNFFKQRTAETNQVKGPAKILLSE